MCDLCEANKEVYGVYEGSVDDFSEMRIEGNKLCVDLAGCCHEYGEFLIKYCPMCGRKLGDADV